MTPVTHVAFASASMLDVTWRMGGRGLLALCFLSLSLPLSGKDLRDYKCVIERIEMAGGSPANLDFLKKNYLGREFTVDRRTGTMAGALKNSYLTSPIVADIGSTENSFKAVTVLKKGGGVGAGSNAYLLVVKEYVSSPTKPFLFADNDVVYFGTCAHF